MDGDESLEISQTQTAIRMYTPIVMKTYQHAKNPTSFEPAGYASCCNLVLFSIMLPFSAQLHLTQPKQQLPPMMSHRRGVMKASIMASVALTKCHNLSDHLSTTSPSPLSKVEVELSNTPTFQCVLTPFDVILVAGCDVTLRYLFKVSSSSCVDTSPHS